MHLLFMHIAWISLVLELLLHLSIAFLGSVLKQLPVMNSLHDAWMLAQSVLSAVCWCRCGCSTYRLFCWMLC
jgi:hypothetical protein